MDVYSVYYITDTCLWLFEIGDLICTHLKQSWIKEFGGPRKKNVDDQKNLVNFARDFFVIENFSVNCISFFNI